MGFGGSSQPVGICGHCCVTHSTRAVCQTGAIPGLVMLLTLFADLVMPLQYTVLMGVGFSVLLFVFHQANRLQLVELAPSDKDALPLLIPADGSELETNLSRGSVTTENLTMTYCKEG